MNNKPSDNYLEYIPTPRSGLKYEITDGNVTIFQENNGLFNYLAQKLLKKPKVTQIHLDETGNFIWPLMDGNNDILAIAEQVKKEFGDKAEPLYDRLVKYIKTLTDCGFVEVKSPEKITQQLL